MLPSCLVEGQDAEALLQLTDGPLPSPLLLLDRLPVLGSLSLDSLLPSPEATLNLWRDAGTGEAHCLKMMSKMEETGPGMLYEGGEPVSGS